MRQLFPTKPQASVGAQDRGAELREMTMNLIRKDGGLFAVDDAGRFIGMIVNDVTGACKDNPDDECPSTFARIFEGHGCIYHQCDNPPNPFFVGSWGKVFHNPEMLPKGTKNVFVDQGEHALCMFNAVLVR